MSSSKVSTIADRDGTRDLARGSRPSVSPTLSSRPSSSCRAGSRGRCAGRGCCASSGPARDRPVISIVAPPGYGKTSLLVQWATEELPAGRLADGRRQRQRPGRAPHRPRGGDRPRRAARHGDLRRDRVGRGVEPDRGRSIAGGDVPTPGARPDRHRRRAPDHLPGVPRHPRGAGRAPARGIAGGHRGTRTDAPPVRPLASRGFTARDRSRRARDGRARGRRAGTRARAAAARRKRRPA